VTELFWWLWLTAGVAAEIVGAFTKLPTLSEVVDRRAGGGKALRWGGSIVWVALGVHLFWGWLQ
jgi:hypothetical protein